VNSDVIIIGAGAAGMMAAIHAAERGRRVLLLEKNRKPGVKILMSGGTRCNITHACDNRGIVDAYGPNGKFLHSALAALTVDQTVQFFNDLGVATKVEETGKIFPVSNKAVDVLNALLARLNSSGAELATEEAVTDLALVDPSIPIPQGESASPGDPLFQIITARRRLVAPKVILTTGGQSYPGCGTRGDGYGFCRRLGHTIVTPRPALVPITTRQEWVAALKGVTLDDVKLSVLDQEKPLLAKRGGFLFAHFGLTGPSPLDVSKAISRHPSPASLMLEIDFLPTIAEPALEEELKTLSLAHGKKQLAVLLAEKLPRRLADELLALAGLERDRKAAGLTRDDRRRLLGALKRQRLPVAGTLGFEKAEVTSGGVALDEVDSRTMQSKKTPGLYLAGEILDLDGPIGGYNFQAAWSAGWLAGRSV
jgi:hypothetical protein